MTWQTSSISFEQLTDRLDSLSNDGFEVFRVFPRRKGRERFAMVVAQKVPASSPRVWTGTTCEYEELQETLNRLEQEGATIFEVFAAREGTHTYPYILSYLPAH